MANTNIIDLLFNYPSLGPESESVVTSLGQRILKDAKVAASYIPIEGFPEYQSIVAEWLSLPNYKIDPEQIAFGVSGHNILTSILLSQTKAGQAIACDSITYNGWINVTRQTERRNIPIAVDSHGMRPDALDEAASKEKLWGVFLMPSLHNPCTTVMPLERRKAIIDVCKKHDLSIIDDDAYQFLNSAAPPSFAHLYPEKSFWIQSLTKPVFSSIKTAVVVAPKSCVGSLVESSRSVAHQPSALTLPWVMDLISSKKIDQVIALKRNLVKERQVLAKQLLSSFEYETTDFSYHLWLTLPTGWTSVSATQALRDAGVAVASGISYSPSGIDPNKIRVALAGEEGLERVKQGLEILVKVLSI